MQKNLIRYIAPFIIFIIVAVFVYNIVTHGYIQHPGKTSYERSCAQCHGDAGEGIRSLIPPLENSDYAKQNFDSIPCWIKNGLYHPITVNGKPYDQPMYPVEMSEVEVSNLMNYMAKEFLEIDREVNSAWVKKQWEGCK
jgi:hypothetical protein